MPHYYYYQWMNNGRNVSGWKSLVDRRNIDGNWSKVRKKGEAFFKKLSQRIEKLFEKKLILCPTLLQIRKQYSKKYSSLEKNAGSSRKKEASSAYKEKGENERQQIRREKTGFPVVTFFHLHSFFHPLIHFSSVAAIATNAPSTHFFLDF